MIDSKNPARTFPVGSLEERWGNGIAVQVGPAEQRNPPAILGGNWKTPFDGANRTQAGSLCYFGFPDCRAISGSHPELSPCTRSDDATA
jgi:hypothetical protein